MKGLGTLLLFLSAFERVLRGRGYPAESERAALAAPDRVAAAV